MVVPPADRRYYCAKSTMFVIEFLKMKKKRMVFTECAIFQCLAERREIRADWYDLI